MSIHANTEVYQLKMLSFQCTFPPELTQAKRWRNFLWKKMLRKVAGLGHRKHTPNHLTHAFLLFTCATAGVVVQLLPKPFLNHMSNYELFFLSNDKCPPEIQSWGRGHRRRWDVKWSWRNGWWVMWLQIEWSMPNPSEWWRDSRTKINLARCV